MGGKSGSSQQTSTTSSEPPAYVKPYIQNALARGEALQYGHPLYRPGLNNFQQQAYNQMGALSNVNPSDFATQQVMGAMGQGLPTTEAAQAYTQGRLSMTPEQQQQELIGAAQPFVSELTPQVNSAAALAGREGSGMAANMFGQGVGNIVAQQQAQLANQQAGLAGLAPGLDMASHNVLGNYARMLPGLDAARYTAPMQRFRAGQMLQDATRAQVEEPWDRLARSTAIMFGNAPATMAGGTTTGTQNIPTQGMNPFGMALGFGSMLGGLGWSPFG